MKNPDLEGQFGGAYPYEGRGGGMRYQQQGGRAPPVHWHQQARQPPHRYDVQCLLFLFICEVYDALRKTARNGR